MHRRRAGSRRPRANQRGGAPLTAILLVAVIVMASLQVRAWWMSHSTAAATAPRAIAPRGDLYPAEQETIRLFEETSPSVVFITTIDLRRDYFANIYKRPAGTGSGFVWDRAGHVVTNFHVIRNADQAQVTLSDQSTWNAKLVGAEPDKDLAVLKIDAPADRLKPIKVGQSNNLRVGQMALAIGNPFGFDQSLTTGVVSALDREIESVTRRPILGVIQTNADINPGNSGGPLLDSAGRLIGVNTAIYSPTGSHAGIGFAVPVDTVNRIVPQLIEHGKVTKPGLGINIAADSFVERRLRKKGVLVLNVLPGGGAAIAGIEPTRQMANGKIVLGDLIKEVDGLAIEDSNDLYRALDDNEVGDSVTVEVEREGETRTLEVELNAIND